MIRTTTLLIGTGTVLVLAAALARVHPFGNAGLFSTGQRSGPVMRASSVPPAVRSILTSKCMDCHSMQTRSPLYARFAPVSWLLERDILLGRRAMNLDAWDQLSVDQQQTFAAKIAQETKQHEMPLLQYRMIHWSSRITDAEILTLAGWARAASGPNHAADSPAGLGDPTRGKMLFEKRCSGCHELTQNREGPRLPGSMDGPPDPLLTTRTRQY